MATEIAIPTLRVGTRDAEQELDAALARFYLDWQRRDPASISALLAPGAHLLLWGAEAQEEISGQKRVSELAAADRWLGSCPPWTALGPRRRVVGGSGRVAWVGDEVEGRFQLEQGEGGGVLLRVSTVWERSRGAWRLAHLHVSEPH